ncbi:MAG: S8 family serine peptidase [Bacteroides sp.]|nr:S8 family serine peptidase [Bacteroides sp.]
MKRFYPVLFLFINLILAQSLWAQPMITPSLQETISEKSAEEFISVNIRLTAQYDEALLLENSRQQRNLSDRRAYVVNTLKAFALQEQAGLISLLRELEAQGKVKDIMPLWIGNLVNCQMLPEVIDVLALRKDLARLDYNKMQQVLDTEILEEPIPEIKSDQLKSGKSIVWSVDLINAPEVWAEGYTGEEVIVAVIDSGVNYNHLDLAGHMWASIAYPYHGYNFLNNSNNPMDDNGHGTHCAGTVAGNGTAGTQTGVAPSATIMALKVLDAGGSGTEAGVWAAIQFSAEHGARVMSLSLGWKHAWGPDRSMWRTTMNNALAAGVIASVAAGNEGESYSDTPPSQVRTPGDIPPPWTHPNQTATGGNSAVVSVGSTTNTDAISSFSSRGPVTWQNIAPFNDYLYNPGTGLIRPDVVAPGSSITSLTYNNNSGYTNKSGTSMATPAVAGLMALMISKNPGITPEQISEILETTALPFSLGKSNTFGSGRIDAFAAVEETPYMGIRYVSHEINENEGNDNSLVNPGENISLTLVMENPTEEDISGVQARLLLTSDYAGLIDSVAVFGDFQAGEVKTLENVFSFQTSEDMPGKHELSFIIEAFVDEEETIWRSRFYETGYAPRLEVTQLKIIDTEDGNGNGRLDPGESAIIQFKVENTGQIPSESLILTLVPDDPLIVINEQEISATSIAQDGFFLANFGVSAHGSIPPGTTSSVNFDLSSGPYAINKDYYLKVGLIIEDWESADFDQFEWEETGNTAWQIVSDEVFEGEFSAKSGTISHSSSTGLSLTIDVVANDTISFYRKVSSENSYDWLEFFMDGVRLDRWSGNQDWEKFSYAVVEGVHTFQWVYVKDYSVSSGADAAWIDNIEMPATIHTVAFAGFDSEQCGSEPFLLEGFASQYEEVLWITSGDGTFEDPAMVETTYTPGTQDIMAGQVTLTLQALRGDEVKAEHSMVLSLMPSPEVDLGEDFTLCVNHLDLLNAGTGYSSYLWSNGETKPHLWVTNEEFGPETTIWVEVTNAYGCTTRDTVVVTFDACLDADLPESTEDGLVIYPNPASSKVNVSFFNPDATPAFIRIIDQRGQVVRSENVQETGSLTREMDLSGIKAGLYYLMVETKNNRLVSPLSIY